MSYGNELGIDQSNKPNTEALECNDKKFWTYYRLDKDEFSENHVAACACIVRDMSDA